MESPHPSAILISDFNIETFAAYLRNDKTLPALVPVIAPFGQVDQTLMDENLDCWEKRHEVAVIWTRPEGVIDSFARLMNFQRVPIEEILAQVDSYAEAIAGIRDRVKTILVPAWVVPSYVQGFGMLDMRKDLGLASALMCMNLRLAEKLDDVRNLFLLNTERWIRAACGEAFNPKLWYMGKIAFGNTVFKEAVKGVKSVVRGVEGGARKIIIVDLDETLWGGIVGDTGWQNLRLGGHDPIGEAFIDFQRTLQSFANRGVLLAIASKNEESVALEAIQKHPEMALKLDDFAGWRINWDDKARNIIELMAELNLGLQSAVFIDDNPAERARVAEALPEVLVPEWPHDRMLYRKTLLELDCFDTPSISEEDSARAMGYRAERSRKSLKSSLGSLDEWLKSLHMKVTVESLRETDIQRTTQLLNKTNQMNLSTRRMSEVELMDWASMGNHQLWTFRVSDKFGDYGLTGIASLAYDGTEGKVVDFILSCRVMGRKIEEAMVHAIVSHAQSLDLKQVAVEYLPTPKNKPCYKFWTCSGFEHDKENDTFFWDLEHQFPKPDCVELVEGGS